MADKSNPYGAKSARKGIKNQLLARLIQAFAGLLTVFITVRLMSIPDYASYVTITAAGTVLGSLSLLGMDRAAFRYLPEGRLAAHPIDLDRMVRRLRWMRTAFMLLLGIAVLIAWPWVGSLFQLGAAWFALPVLAFGFVHALVQFSEVVMQSLMLQRALRDAISITWAVRLVALAGIAVATGVLSTSTAISITIGSEAIGLAWMTHKTRQYFRESIAAGSSSPIGVWPSNWGRIRKFAFQNYAMAQSSLAAQPKVQTLVAAAFLPQDAVAAFSFFRSLADQFARLLPFHMLRTVIEPVLMGQYQASRDFGKLNTVASSILKANLLISLPVAIWIWIAGAPAVSMISGGKFADSVWVLAVLVLSLVPTTQRTLQVTMVNAVDASAWLVPAAVAASLVTMVVTWSQIPRFGLVALVISDFVFAAAFALLIVRALKSRGFLYRPDLKGLAQIYFLATFPLGVGLAIKAVHGPVTSPLESGAVAMLVCGIFLVGNLLWKPFLPEERAIMKRVTPRGWFPF